MNKQKEYAEKVRRQLTKNPRSEVKTPPKPSQSQTLDDSCDKKTKFPVIPNSPAEKMAQAIAKREKVAKINLDEIICHDDQKARITTNLL